MLFENSDLSSKNYIFASEKVDKIYQNKRILFYYSNIKTYSKRQFLFKVFFFNLFLEKNLEDLIIKKRKQK